MKTERIKLQLASARGVAMYGNHWAQRYESDVTRLLDEIDRLNAEIARLSDKYNALAYRVDL